VGTEAHHNRRPHDADLGLQPWAARSDLLGARLLVKTTLPGGTPLEVLDHIGHVGLPAIDARLVQRTVPQGARRAHEGLALQVLTIARLLAHEHDGGARRTFAEDSLRGVAVKIASLAAGRQGPELLQRGPFGDQVSGRGHPVDSGARFCQFWDSGARAAQR
jgi:hypothetical protein